MTNDTSTPDYLIRVKTMHSIKAPWQHPRQYERPTMLPLTKRNPQRKLHGLVLLLMGVLLAHPDTLRAQDGETNISEMVNLSTGDLSYSLPLMSLPGKGYDFPLVMSYSPAIGLLQEASWVGLGWQLDPGAIHRQVSQIPDDFKGEVIYTHQEDPGEEKTTNNPSIFKRLSDKITKQYGKAKVDFDRSVYGSNSAAMSNYMGNVIRTYYLLESFNPIGQSKGNPHLGAGLYFHLSSSLFGTRMNADHLSSWDWILETSEKKRKLLWFNSGTKSVTYRYYLDILRKEYAYGLLYQSALPTTRTASGMLSYSRLGIDENNFYSRDDFGTSSDYYQKNTEGGKAIFDNTAPIYWSPDNYRIQTPTISGELVPLRFDNASVSTSFSSNKSYKGRLALEKFSVGSVQEEKVQFILMQDYSGGFDGHLPTDDRDMALRYSVDNYFHDEGNTEVSTLKLGIQSPTLDFRPEAGPGFNGSNTLYKGVDIQWFSNEELREGRVPGRFMESPGLDRSARKGHHIGAFMATDKNGYTYHFAIPVMGRQEDYMQVTTTSSKNYSLDNHAVKWLLTAITGPDFRDVGTLPGQVDHDDTGEYVVFGYGKFSDAFIQRFPLTGTRYSAKNSDARSYSENHGEHYYLNTIATNTHTALFVKKNRRDYRSKDNKDSSLALEEIILLRNEHFDYLKEALDFEYKDRLGNYHGHQDQVLKSEDIHRDPAIRDYVRQHALRKVRLSHDYSLCQGVPNAIEGKLTLQRLSLYGKKNENLAPSYHFDYGFNPRFGRNSWDAWGLYKNNDLEGPDRHKVSSNSDGAAWSLSQVSQPQGATLHIDYERDSYSTVSGVPLEDGLDSKYGGSLRVKSLRLKNREGELLRHYRYAYELPDGSSSGVATKEPSHCQGRERAVDDIYRYPDFAVTYAQVSVLQESVQGDGFLSRTVHRFATADEATVTLKRPYSDRHTIFEDTDRVPYTAHLFGERLKQQAYVTEYRTGHIGRPLSIATYTPHGRCISKVEHTYEESGLGGFTQSLNLLDKTLRNYRYQPTPSSLHKFDLKSNYRFINSVSRYIPSLLKATTTTDAYGVTHHQLFLERDRFSGAVLKNLSYDGLGHYQVEESRPAYKKYPGMGLVAQGGRNLLQANAAVSTFKVSPDYVARPAESEKIGLLNSSVTTWNHNDGFHQVTASSTDGPVFREDRSYTYHAPKALDLTGASPMEDYTEFDAWQEGEVPSSGHWWKTATVERVDAHSHVLESTDINGAVTLQKSDIQQEHIIAKAVHAEYGEVVYSGAEDMDFRNGNAAQRELRRGQGIILGPEEGYSPHTGTRALGLAGNKKGFVFDARHLHADKIYRISVWTNDASGRIYCRYKEGNSTTHGTDARKKAGDWYLIDVDLTFRSDNLLEEVGVTTSSANAILFDDFRLHPLSAPMESYVYNEWNESVATLDANNLASLTEYDALGRVVATYQESFGRGIIKTAARTYHMGGMVADRRAYLDDVDFTFYGKFGAGKPMTFEVEGAHEEYGPYSFEWSFSDGSIQKSTNSIIQKTFSTTGSKVVVLTLQTADGSYEREIRKRLSIHRDCPARGAVLGRYCEVDSDGCNTGREMVIRADGNCSTTRKYEGGTCSRGGNNCNH